MQIRQTDHERESFMRMIINPIVHLCKTLIVLILIILWPVLVNGATIFSDNFDTCTNNCYNTSAGPPNSAAWMSWDSSAATTATVRGVTHYSGEITSPGRGDTGKSLKMWRAGSVFGDYGGGLNLNNISGSYDHIFMRYYIKIPTGFTSSQDFKYWRLMTNSGTAGYNEIYLNYYGGTWSIYDGNPWQDLISASQYNSLLHDGNWHCVEFEIGITSHILRFWIDDVLRYENTNRTWHLTGNFSGFVMQSFTIGNTYDHTGKWQSSWQAMEADDFVLSTTYVGLGSGGATPPPAPPPPLPKQPNPPGNILLQ